MNMEPPPKALEKGLSEIGGMAMDDSRMFGMEKEDEQSGEPLHFNFGLFRVRKERPVRRQHNLMNLAICLFVITSLPYIASHLSPYNPFQDVFRVCIGLRLCDGRINDRDDYLNDCSNVITRPEDLSNESRILHEIPQYVLDYAPLVHLYSEEQFWPCDIAEHLFHVTPELNYTPIEDRLQYSNLTNLNDLNEFENGRHVYLTSNDNVEERPDWLGGQKNIPNHFSDGEETIQTTRNGARPGSKKTVSRNHGGRSAAPAVLITVNKGNGIVDAFWFYFYSYNLGNIVLNIRFGNHVGDWEHSLIRFQHGKPKLVFYSEHYFGEAYNYSAVEKIGKRVSSYHLAFVGFVG